MSEQENVNIVRRLFDAWNKNDIPASEKYYTDDFKSIQPGAPEMDARAYGDLTRMYSRAMPDSHFDVKDVIAQGDKVAVTYLVTGTHTGPLAMPNGDTLPPTNRKISVPGSMLFEFRNGKISRLHDYYDQLTFMSQLGLAAQQPQSSQASRAGSHKT